MEAADSGGEISTGALFGDSWGDKHVISKNYIVKSALKLFFFLLNIVKLWESEQNVTVKKIKTSLQDYQLDWRRFIKLTHQPNMYAYGVYEPMCCNQTAAHAHGHLWLLTGARGQSIHSLLLHIRCFNVADMCCLLEPASSEIWSASMQSFFFLLLARKWGGNKYN